MDDAAAAIAKEANKCTITEEYIEHLLSSYGIGYTYVEELEKAPVDAYDYSGINVPLVAVCNVPPVAQCNVPPQKWLQ